MVLNFVVASAQCTIVGADQIQVGERQNYSVMNAAENCVNCYQWTHLDQKIILESDTKANPLTLKGAVPGKAKLSLEIRGANALAKCSKVIKVIAPTSNVLTVNEPKCNILVDGFKEIRVSNNVVSFEPNTTESGFSYKWTVIYRSGNEKISTDKKGTFDFSNDNVIDKVELEILVNQCTKTITKTYNNYFWWFF